MTTVVVSPHLDDAIFSVPGLVRSLRAKGEPVVVVSVFTEGDSRHTARKEEDRAATSILGATAVNLGLLDAPFRRKLGETFRDLMFSDLPDHDHDADAVAALLFDHIEKMLPTSVFFPLGVGQHIDHRVVHRAHRRFESNVWFYEERPYSMIRHAVRARMATLGATLNGSASESSLDAAAEYLADAPRARYIRAYLPANQHAEDLPRLANALVSPNAPSGLHLHERRLTFDDETFAIALRAMQGYSSQIDSLFDVPSLPAALRPAGTPYEERVYLRA